MCGFDYFNKMHLQYNIDDNDAKNKNFKNYKNANPL